MKISIPLVTTFLRQTLPVTLVGLPIVGLYVLFASEPLRWDDKWVALFILCHSIAIAVSLGRFRSSAFAFLYQSF